MAGDDSIRGGANGLATFAVHVGDEGGKQRLGAMRSARYADPAFALPNKLTMKALSSEEAALRQARQAFASEHLPGLAAPKSELGEQELKSIGAERAGLTDTTVVKFRQTFRKIPVYGSLVSVELDDDNELVSIQSCLGAPEGVSPVAAVPPAEALEVAASAAGREAPAGAVPRLNYYFDDGGKWRLVYIVEDMPVATKTPQRTAPMFDFVVDAQTGELVAQLPRTPTLVVQARDGQGRLTDIVVSELHHAALVLRDPELNVHTFDFGFLDPDASSHHLPGEYVKQAGGDWNPMAVSAHANATQVVRFLRDVLQRHNIDNKGGPLKSSINCVVRDQSPDGKVWDNAFWNSVQMVYGQRKVGSKLVSLAVSLDIVGHEIFHGVTERTARLEYAKQSGALNEALSDIFGVILSNRGIADFGKWNWEVGDGLGGPAFRDMKRPSKHGQPEDMTQFQVLPNTEDGDWGGVHTNSGIPNRAAYLLITTKAEDDSYLFTPDDAAAIFYIALTQSLSRTSNFSQFRIAVDQAVKSLFRKQPPGDLKARIDAVKAAFDTVKIP